MISFLLNGKFLNNGLFLDIHLLKAHTRSIPSAPAAKIPTTFIPPIMIRPTAEMPANTSVKAKPPFFIFLFDLWSLVTLDRSLTKSRPLPIASNSSSSSKTSCLPNHCFCVDIPTILFVPTIFLIFSTLAGLTLLTEIMTSNLAPANCSIFLSIRLIITALLISKSPGK